MEPAIEVRQRATMKGQRTGYWIRLDTVGILYSWSLTGSYGSRTLQGPTERCTCL